MIPKGSLKLDWEVEIAIVIGTRARYLYLTLVHVEPEGEAVFPPYDRGAFREVRREPRAKGPDDEHAFTFVDLERRPPAALR